MSRMSRLPGGNPGRKPFSFSKPPKVRGGVPALYDRIGPGGKTLTKPARWQVKARQAGMRPRQRARLEWKPAGAPVYDSPEVIRRGLALRSPQGQAQLRRIFDSSPVKVRMDVMRMAIADPTRPEHETILKHLWKGPGYTASRGAQNAYEMLPESFHQPSTAEGIAQGLEGVVRKAGKLGKRYGDWYYQNSPKTAGFNAASFDANGSARKALGNLGRNAGEFYPQLALATYQLGKDTVEKGPVEAAKKNVYEPVKEVVEHPVRSLEENPLTTALIFKGLGHVPGRTAGAVARSGVVGARAKEAAAVARPYMEVDATTGQLAKRHYSKDLLVKQAQKRKDRRYTEKVAQDDVARNPKTGNERAGDQVVRLKTPNQDVFLNPVGRYRNARLREMNFALNNEATGAAVRRADQRANSNDAMKREERGLAQVHLKQLFGRPITEGIRVVFGSEAKIKGPDGYATKLAEGKDVLPANSRIAGNRAFLPDGSTVTGIVDFKAPRKGRLAKQRVANYATRAYSHVRLGTERDLVGHVADRGVITPGGNHVEQLSAELRRLQDAALKYKLDGSELESNLRARKVIQSAIKKASKGTKSGRYDDKIAEIEAKLEQHNEWMRNRPRDGSVDLKDLKARLVKADRLVDELYDLQRRNASAGGKLNADYVFGKAREYQGMRNVEENQAIRAEILTKDAARRRRSLPAAQQHGLVEFDAGGMPSARAVAAVEAKQGVGKFAKEFKVVKKRASRAMKVEEGKGRTALNEERIAGARRETFAIAEARRGVTAARKTRYEDRARVRELETRLRKAREEYQYALGKTVYAEGAKNRRLLSQIKTQAQKLLRSTNEAERQYAAEILDAITKPETSAKTLGQLVSEAAGELAGGAMRGNKEVLPSGRVIQVNPRVGYLRDKLADMHGSGLTKDLADKQAQVVGLTSELKRAKRDMNKQSAAARAAAVKQAQLAGEERVTAARKETATRMSRARISQASGMAQAEMIYGRMVRDAEKALKDAQEKSRNTARYRKEKMPARFVEKGKKGTNAEEVATADLEAMLREAGVDTEALGYVPHEPGDPRKGDFYQRDTTNRTKTLMGDRYTGTSWERANYDASTAAIEARNVSQALTRSVMNSMADMIREIGVPARNGSGELRLFTADAAKKMIDETKDENNAPRFIAVRAFRASDREASKQLTNSLENQKDGISLGDIFERTLGIEIQHGKVFKHQAVGVKGLDLSDPKVIRKFGKTANIVLVDRVAMGRILRHAELQLGLPMVGAAFRRTVLPFSPRWMGGNIAEAILRSTINGVNPAHARVYANLLAKMMLRDEQWANHYRYNTEGGLLAGSQLNMEVKTDLTLKVERKAALNAVRSVAIKPSDAIFKFNKGLEDAFQRGMAGKHAMRELRAFDHSWVKAMRGQQQALDEMLTSFEKNPAKAYAHLDDAARYTNDALGKYTQFSPQLRRLIQGYAPFMPWYLNSVRFFAYTLPIGHPLLTSVLAASTQAIDQDLKDRAKQAPSAALRAGIPIGDKRVLDVARITPLGAITEPAKTLSKEVVPMFSSPMAILAGVNPIDWTQRLRDSNGNPIDSEAYRIFLAVNSFVEATVPYLSLGRRLWTPDKSQSLDSFIGHIRVNPNAQKKNPWMQFLSPVQIVKYGGKKTKSTNPFDQFMPKGQGDPFKEFKPKGVKKSPFEQFTNPPKAQSSSTQGASYAAPSSASYADSMPVVATPPTPTVSEPVSYVSDAPAQKTIRGKTSWFGGPNDRENTGTALGLPDTVRGLAVYNQSTLGGYWRVRWPNGRVSIERQVDIGPAPWTGRKIDFTSAAIRANGYTEQNFPTDSRATIEYLGKNKPSQQALPSAASSSSPRATSASSKPVGASLFKNSLIGSPFKNDLTGAVPLAPQPETTAPAASTAASTTASVAASRGTVTGVPLSNPTVRDVVSQIAGIYGKPVTVSSGKRSTKYTSSGNVSDHYTGNAADLAASGTALTRLGQSALIAAGMSPAQAKKQTGGVFNLNKNGKRYQIIFNSNVGGNHYNHLHIGVK